MAVLNQLCKKSICLNDGSIVAEGETGDVIDYYLNQNSNKSTRIISEKKDGENKFTLVYMTDSILRDRTEYKYDEEIVVGAELYLPAYSSVFELAMRLVNKHGSPVFTIHEKLDKYYKGNDVLKLNIVIPKQFITPGKYSWTMCINEPGVKFYDVQTNILPFLILDTGSEFIRYDGIDYGSVFAKYLVQNMS
jgi:lipopolysaccharide transport system ATP-binding protein